MEVVLVILCILIVGMFIKMYTQNSAIDELTEDRRQDREERASLVQEVAKLQDANNQQVHMISSYQARIVEKDELHRLEFIKWKAEEEKRIRKDAVARSTVVNTGFAGEYLAPLLSEFPTKDFRPMGDPIDYVVFVGADSIRSGESKILDEIIFLEVKTGKAQLNTIQRRIRDAITAGRVRFAMYNATTSETRYWPERSEGED